jgi:hypothetical protein
MKIGAQNLALSLAAAACFLDSFLAKGEDPGPLLTAVFGILLVRRAVVVTRQSPVVIIAGCALTAMIIAGNHGWININKPMWIALVLLGFVCFGWWERIQKLWSRPGLT